MINTIPIRATTVTAGAQLRRATIVWWLWFLCLSGVTCLVGIQMLSQGPSPVILGWLCYWAGVGAILYQPRCGVYLIVCLTLAGDPVLSPWYPFIKNFSSYESLLFVDKAVIFSPVESYIVLTFVSWLGRALAERRLDLYKGLLFWPALIFVGFVTYGLLYGLSHYGDTNIALWETRAIYYLPAMLVLTTNLIRTRGQVSLLIWLLTMGLFAKGVSGTWYVATVLDFNISSVEAIATHAYSMHANSFIVLVIAVWVYRGSYARRIVLPLMLPWVLIGYTANQRRAGYVALMVAMLLVVVVLYRERRTAFWLIVPLASLLLALYIGAFWNSNGALGQPARAVKSAIAPDLLGERDSASNQYRALENINIMFTIKMAPLTGVGFGKKFYIIAPMPSIAESFTWWEYITHNSIMWMWMQIGLGGFISMLFLIGLSVSVGARVLWRMPGDDMGAIALTALLYIMMHFIYAYVDMSWDVQSMVYVGAMMGLLNNLERIVARSLLRSGKRWPWQSDPAPVPGLRPA
jgi:hypothetical protein